MSIPNGTPTVEDVYEALDTVKDPCMVAGGHELSILDLGLVYSVEAKDGCVRVDMTLTEVGCIFTHRVFSDVYDAIEALTGVKEVEVVPCWMPVWTEERLNQKARTALEGSRTAMFRTIKRSSLDAYEKSEWQREDLRVGPAKPLAACERGNGAGAGGGGATPITQEGVQESEAGEIDQIFEVS